MSDRTYGTYGRMAEQITAILERLVERIGSLVCLFYES